MIELYATGAALTAVYLWHSTKPREPGECLAYLAFVALWPAVMAFAIYAAIKRA